MGKSRDQDGCATVLGGACIGVVVLVSMIPKEVWIVLGVIVVGALLCWGGVSAASAYEKRRVVAEEQARAAEVARAAAEKRDREQRAREEAKRRVETLGEKNAALVDIALGAVKQVVGSEAARAGWLGDIDFSADIREITDKFGKAHALRKVTNELSALDKPGDDDRRILAEAKTTAADLECAAIERVELIGKCATEARRIDQSLRDERKDAQTEEQRAELHAKLSAMLYGIEATPDTAARDSAADAVMARVQAYREIKSQIQRARDGTTG